MFQTKTEDQVKDEGIILPNTMVNADCLEVMKYIPDASIDCILTDPPYGTTQCKWDSIIPLDKMWEELKRVIKPNGAIVLFGSQPFTSILIASNLLDFKYQWIWNKGKAANFPCVKYQPLKIHEDIIVFNSNKYTYFPIMSEGKTRLKGGYPVDREVAISSGTPIKTNNTYYPKSILDFSTAGNLDCRLHPTQKPVPLMEYLIKTYTKEGETILDFTSGSFTTGVACVNTNRRFIGIEKDEGYFNVGVNRINTI